MSSLRPTSNDLWFVPLGGAGEIGMNMNLYGHNQRWLMVDCGATFQSPINPADDDVEHAVKVDVLSADPSFIENRRDDLCGIIITHAHEDHVGALPALWHKFKCPVYTTAFTAEVLRRKLFNSHQDIDIPIVIVDEGTEIDIGPFTVKWLYITHSLPEPMALFIQTTVGNVFHTADWKIDPNPVIGQAFSSTVFSGLAKLKPLAMVCDSTNALRPGHSISEQSCAKGLFNEIKQCEGRVIVTCFGSNVARLITLATIASRTGRYFALMGRSLDNMLSIARLTGYWPDDLKVVDRRHMGYLPKEEVLIVATGSQGERRAALGKMAMESHRDIDLDAGDTIIFSTITIPGNEKPIEKMITQFKARQINVIQAHDTELPIHASGHPCADELSAMYGWIKPKIAVPVHGEVSHMRANADIAQQAGVNKQLVGKNGDLYILAPQASIRRSVIKTGRLDLNEL